MSQDYFLRLPVRVGDEELLRLGQEQSILLRDVAQLEEAKRMKQLEFRQQIGEKMKRANEISEIVCTKQELRDVEVRKEFDFASGLVTITRLDSGELVEQRPSTLEEQQQSLDLL